MKKAIIIAMLVSLLAGLGVGCGTKAAPNGTLKLNLSDTPVNGANITGVFITISEIQYYMNDEWKTFSDFHGPQTYNLMELTAGNFAPLGSLTLPAGEYTQLRFMLDAPKQDESPTNPGSYLKFSDSTTTPLFVPSGAETGYKATGDFKVPVNGTVEITADFDVSRAVVKAGNSGKYLLKPTIRLIVNGQAGGITGSVSNAPAYPDIAVFAYADGTWASSESAEPASGATRFPGAVTSARAKDGSYTLALLAPGTYDLVVVGFTGDAFGAVLGFVSNVVVTAGTATTRNIDPAALATSLPA